MAHHHVPHLRRKWVQEVSDNMYDLDGWAPISCASSEELRADKTPVSSLTDPDGTHGTPIVYTEWATDDGTPVLRDYRWPNSSRECEHYTPVVTS